ncbi:MAG: phosphoenolpyruvate carboxykinase [bacterium]|nr:phosphoenolpyruvate carboxykinase [bacterium]
MKKEKDKPKPSHEKVNEVIPLAEPKPISRNLNISLQERNELIKLAERYLGYDSLYIWNANLNGIILQLRTNDAHLDDFWRENWYPALLDHSLRPHGTLYAISGITDMAPGLFYHSGSKTGFILSSNFYGEVRSLALGIALDISEEHNAVHFIRGALVDVNGEGVVITGLTDSGRSTHSFLLLQMDRARIHSNEWIYVEHLGGEKGRLSTHVSDRKFYLKSSTAKINPRIKELLKKCKEKDGYIMLDPLWIGGQEKYLDTTRIKLFFFLVPDVNDPKLAKRLKPEEALSLLVNAKQPFFNPHALVINNQRKALQTEFFKEVFNFAAAYQINTVHPVFEVQRKMREIIISGEYMKPMKEIVMPVALELKLPQIDTKLLSAAVTELYQQSNVQHITPLEAKRMAEPYGTKTRFGNYNFVSTVKNRSAGLTVYVGSPRVMQSKLNPRQKEILKSLPRTIEEVNKYLKRAPFVCTERTMGDNNYFAPRCRLFVSVHRKEMVRLAHMINQTLLPLKEKTKGPLLNLVYIPEWQEKDRQILVFPEIGITYVLGSDYYGEAKKGFLRMAMWHAKEQGMLGLHAGAKILKARGIDGKIRKYSMIIFGLTATGKTTHSCHDHGLTGKGEGIEIVQDDFVALRKDGACLGTEQGFYLKTEGVNPEVQPLIYQAATTPNAIFENVMVDYLGNVLFDDETLTGNGRGIMQRSDFGTYASPSINLPPLEEVDGMIVAFITRRNTVVPIVSKLTIEQAAAAFMLGESIESSGSDPRRAGESVREVGTNPFIVGSEAEEGNIFYNFLKSHPEKVHCYLLNTGGVGEITEISEEGTKVVRQKVLRVQIPEMAAIIRGIARGSIEWKKDEYWNVMVPNSVEGMDINRFELTKFYPEVKIEELVHQLRLERIEYIQNFKGLDSKIVDAVKEL